MMIRTFTIALAFGSIVPGAAYAAPGEIALSGEVKLERTIVEQGKSRLVLLEPKVVVPGDRLVFTTRYVNSGLAPARNFVVTNPLPAAVVLAPGAPADADVSVDGSKTWGALAALTVADGKGGRRPAGVADVTHIRWTIPTIAAGASGTVTYHAVVR